MSTLYPDQFPHQDDVTTYRDPVLGDVKWATAGAQRDRATNTYLFQEFHAEFNLPQLGNVHVVMEPDPADGTCIPNRNMSLKPAKEDNYVVAINDSQWEGPDHKPRVIAGMAPKDVIALSKRILSQPKILADLKAMHVDGIATPAGMDQTPSSGKFAPGLASMAPGLTKASSCKLAP